MGWSWVRHGLDKTRFLPKNPFFFEISRVITGRSWVCHGLIMGWSRSAKPTRLFPVNFWKKAQKCNHDFLFIVPCKSRDLLSRSLRKCYKQGQKRHILVMYYCGPRPRREHCMLAWLYVLFRSSAKKGAHELCTFLVLGQKGKTLYFIISWSSHEMYF